MTATYEEMIAHLAGADPKPFDIEKFRCSTIDGWRIDPTEAFMDSLINSVRRVVIDARGLTIDMGEARFFTGLARLAGQIGPGECRGLRIGGDPATLLWNTGRRRVARSDRRLV